MDSSPDENVDCKNGEDEESKPIEIKTNSSKSQQSSQKKLKSLTCKLINARSLVNKLVDLDTVIEFEDPDIIGITESWTTKDVADRELCKNGYNMYRRDRINKRGGGVIVYTKEYLHTEIITDHNDDQVESLFCKIGKGKTSVHLGLFYRPPNNTEIQDAALFAQITKMAKRRTILMGDFNMPKIDWETMSADSQGIKFRDVVLDNFLHQCVKLPTRNENILDLVFETEENLVKSVDITPPLGSSDHSSVTFQIKMQVESKKVNKKPNFKKANIAMMREELEQINWSTTLENKTTEEAWSLLAETVDGLIEKHVPLQAEASRNKSKWATAEAKKLIKRKNSI